MLCLANCSFNASASLRNQKTLGVQSNSEKHKRRNKKQTIDF